MVTPLFQILPGRRGAHVFYSDFSVEAGSICSARYIGTPAAAPRVLAAINTLFPIPITAILGAA